MGVVGFSLWTQVEGILTNTEFRGTAFYLTMG